MNDGRQLLLSIPRDHGEAARRIYRQMLDVCDRLGWARGRAYYFWVDTVGIKPPFEWRFDEPLTPTPQLIVAAQQWHAQSLRRHGLPPPKKAAAPVREAKVLQFPQRVPS